MKTSLKCPKCGGTHILHVTQPLPSVTSASSSGGTTRSTPLAWLAPTHVRVLGLIDATQRLTGGDLDAGVCRACGYVELYCVDPQNIPVDGVYVRELIGPAK